MTAGRFIALAVVAGLAVAVLIGRCSGPAAMLWIPAGLQGLLGLQDDDEGPPSGIPQAPREQVDLGGMVLVPAGPFISGIDDERRGLAARTRHVEAFWIDLREVTNREYDRFVQAAAYPPSPFRQDPRYGAAEVPVVGVNWHDARAYCWWTRKRLPTEVEWEKAARGTEGYPFPWGRQFDTACANLQGQDDGFDGLAPVGSFPLGASPFGAQDMAGNVWEWCRDWYDPFAYRPAPADGEVDDEIRAGSYRQHRRVIRGGAWVTSPELVFGMARDGLDPYARGVHFGFRCARDAD